MKKLVFLLPIAALAMASCSNDSVVEQPTTKVVSAEALQIYPELQGITRGTVWDNGNFAEFKLTTSGTFQEDEETVNATTGTKKFTGETVTKTSGTWGFEGGTIYYWPSKSYSSNFQAWAPVDVTAGSYTASTTIANQKDIVVAYNEGEASTFESGVPLKFRHILSQIIVKADNADKNEIQIKVKGIRLNNVATNNTWKLPTASTVSSLQEDIWTSTPGTNDDYVASITETTLTDGSATDITGSNPLLLIPQQLNTADISKTGGAGSEKSGQYLSVLVQIKSGTDWIYPKRQGDGESGYAWAAVDINTKWEAGKKYIYTLHFTKNGYGKVDGDQGDGGEEKPGSEDPDNPDPNDPQPGEDIIDTPVKLILDVEVIDWVDGTTANESIDM